VNDDDLYSMGLGRLVAVLRPRASEAHVGGMLVVVTAEPPPVRDDKPTLELRRRLSAPTLPLLLTAELESATSAL
jgi:hypothetical protein